jgi:hypothetical protein
MKITVARFGLRVAVVATTVAIAVGLTGCLQSTAILPGNSSTASASTGSSPGPSASASSTPTPGATAPRFSENCGILLTPAQVYAYNPNFVADTGYSPKSGTVAAQVAANSGQICGWLDETSGSVIVVAIATPLSANLAAAKTAASGGTPISAGGEKGFFGVSNGIGSAQFFFGSFWLVVSSPDFATASDASAIYPTVVQNQLSAGG